jgi:hypothetical protein
VSITVRRNESFNEPIHFGLRTCAPNEEELTAQPEINYDEFDKQSEMKAGELS